MLARMRADHDEARTRVAAHVSRTDEALEASAVADRQLTVQRAEVTDGLTGYRRTVREMGDARDALAREQALSASLSAELQAAYVSRSMAERQAAQRLEELNALRGILNKVQADMRAELQTSNSKVTALSAISAADAVAQTKRLPNNSRFQAVAVSAPSSATPNASAGVTLFTTGDGEGAAGFGESVLSLREELLDTLRQARTRASEESGAVELLVQSLLISATLVLCAMRSDMGAARAR